MPLIGKNGTVVKKIDQPDDTFVLFKVYFEGSKVLRDMNQLQIEECLIDNMTQPNFEFMTSTLNHGGTIEHQRVTLSSDSGFLRNVPAFKVSIFDESFNFSTPCLNWGVSSLGISDALHSNYLIDSGLFVGDSGIETLSDNLYEIEVSHVVSSNMKSIPRAMMAYITTVSLPHTPFVILPIPQRITKQLRLLKVHANRSNKCFKCIMRN